MKLVAVKLFLIFDALTLKPIWLLHTLAASLPWNWHFVNTAHVVRIDAVSHTAAAVPVLSVSPQWHWHFCSRRLRRQCCCYSTEHCDRVSVVSVAVVEVTRFQPLLTLSAMILRHSHFSGCSSRCQCHCDNRDTFMNAAHVDSVGAVPRKLAVVPVLLVWLQWHKYFCNRCLRLQCRFCTTDTCEKASVVSFDAMTLTLFWQLLTFSVLWQWPWHLWPRQCLAM